MTVWIKDDVAAPRRWQAFRTRYPEASLWALAASQAAAMLGFNVFLRLLVQ